MEDVIKRVNLFGVMPEGPDVLEISACDDDEEFDESPPIEYATPAEIRRMKKWLR
jgi:hypothetical protein